MFTQRRGYATFKTGKRLNDVPALFRELQTSSRTSGQVIKGDQGGTRIPSSPHRISDITAVTAATISVVCSVSWRVGQITLRTSVPPSRCAKATVALPLRRQQRDAHRQQHNKNNHGQRTHRQHNVTIKEVAPDCQPDQQHGNDRSTSSLPASRARSPELR